MKTCTGPPLEPRLKRMRRYSENNGTEDGGGVEVMVTGGDVERVELDGTYYTSSHGGTWHTDLDTGESVL